LFENPIENLHRVFPLVTSSDLLRSSGGDSPTQVGVLQKVGHLRSKLLAANSYQQVLSGYCFDASCRLWSAYNREAHGHAFQNFVLCAAGDV
jgi:hypothetical protein